MRTVQGDDGLLPGLAREPLGRIRRVARQPDEPPAPLSECLVGLVGFPQEWFVDCWLVNFGLLDFRTPDLFVDCPLFVV